MKAGSTGKNEPNFRPAARRAGRDKSGQWPVAGEIEEAETTMIKKRQNEARAM
jgi:hypothetical protein